MARIAGVNLPKEKRIEAALTVIYGVGRKLSILFSEERYLNKRTAAVCVFENPLKYNMSETIIIIKAIEKKKL